MKIYIYLSLLLEIFTHELMNIDNNIFSDKPSNLPNIIDLHEITDNIFQIQDKVI